MHAMDKENSEHSRWKESMQTLLGALHGDHLLESFQPYNIPIVPDHLRKWDENAYMPKVVSIGPRYRGRRDLLPMEENKWRCMMSLLNRTHDRKNGFEKCMEAILKLDAAVRASYVDEIKLNRYELATIMVFDGCFLLELLVCGSNELDTMLYRKHPDNPGRELRKMDLVLSDLTLLENQIPLFILRTLFEELFKGEGVSGEVINNLPLSLFGFSPDLRGDDLPGSHFIQIAARFYIHGERGEMKSNMNNESQHVIIIGGKEAIYDDRLNRCATRLQAVGITIKSMNDKNAPASGTFKFYINFNYVNGILEISPLNITQTTEAQWRNFIAWEHSSSSRADRCCIFTSSALLFSDLICCASDVQLLKDKGVIIDHSIKSNRDLVAFFHSITKGVDRSIIDPVYSNMFRALNTYSTASRGTKIPKLLYHYIYRSQHWIYSLHKFICSLHEFFRRGHRFFATIFTFLTVVQTCYAIIAYHFPKKS